MQILKKQYITLFLAILSFFILIALFKWIDYLTKNKYITEYFTSLPLTTSYSCINSCHKNPLKLNFGLNTWKKSFNEENRLFNLRYKPSSLQYMFTYPKRYSLTGEFIEDGPLSIK